MEEQAPPPSLAQFASGCLLLVDKPTDWTSFDVVNKIRGHLRRALGVKKIKVGHAGTLDPMATGLLLICTGKWTKKLADMQGMDKGYTGTLRLGATTPSYDAETEVDQTFPYEHLTPADLDAARRQLIGPLEQLPPVFSAIKVDGQPLYKKARKGEKVEVKPRPVTIHAFELTRIELPNVDFYVHCSKGTYIRSLAYDFGRLLDSGAYLTALRRTWIGPHRIEDAWDLEELVEHIDSLAS
jgi:tRNA pseudouridine55 synthase